MRIGGELGRKDQPALFQQPYPDGVGIEADRDPLYRATQQFAFVGKHARLVPNSDEGVEPPGLLAFPGERVGSPAQHGRLAVREAEPASQPGGHQRHLLSAEPAFLPAPQRSHQ